MLVYPASAWERARRAWLCSPFQAELFQAMSQRGIPLVHVWGQAGCQQGYTQRQLSELEAELELMWLIQVGVLRREVDGQGITDSYRLAPLGRQILNQISDLTKPITLWDHWLNRLTKLRLRR